MPPLKPNKTRVFTVKHTFADGLEVDGQFTCKKITILDKSKIGMRRSQLAGGMYCVRDEEGNPTGQGLDPDTDVLNLMIAHLEVSLVQKPDWFKLDELDDYELIEKVAVEVFSFEKTFLRQRGESDSGNGSGSSGEAASGQESQVQNARSIPKTMVGKEIQTALEP